MKYKCILYWFLFNVVVNFSFAQKDQYERESFDSAKTYFNNGDFYNASVILNKLIQSQTQDKLIDTVSYFEMHNVLGVCNTKLNKFSEAEILYKKVISFYESAKILNDNNYHIALVSVGTLYYLNKDYNKAKIFFQKSAALYKKYKGVSDKDYQTLLSNLAKTQIQLLEYSSADSSYSELVKAKKESVGIYNLEYIQVIHNAAALKKVMSKYKEAESLYLEELKIFKDSIGIYNTAYISVLSNLADLYKIINDFARAESFFAEAIQMRNQSEELKHSKENIFDKEVLAGLFKLKGKYTDAEYLLKQVVASCQSIGNTGTTEYAIALSQLAGIHRNIGQYNQSETEYLESLSVLKNTLGEKHKDYASVLNNLALLYDETGRYEQAEELYKRDISITKEVLGDNHPDYATSLNNLAALYKSMGKYNLAEPMYLDALNIRRKTLGATHPEYAVSMNNLAGLYQSVGRDQEAIPLYEQALQIIKTSLGETHPDYALALNNLAGLYEILQNYPQSEKLYKQSEKIIKNTLGEAHPDYAITLNNIALLLEKQGRFSESETYFKRDLQIVEKSFGTQHPSYATSISNLAGLYENMGKYLEAEKLYLNALKIRGELLGEKHPDYGTLLANIARVSSVLKKYSAANDYWKKAIDNYLYQIKTYFPTMSEREKGEFYFVLEKKFQEFNSFAISYYQKDPSVLSQMYNYQLATKALLFNASNKVRKRILASGDSDLIDKYKKWQSDKELIAKYYTRYTKQESGSINLNIDSLERKVNQLEKELSQKSELFKNANDNISYTWKDVQSVLKPDEAAIEVIRFTQQRPDSGGVHTDSIIYAFLIVKNGQSTNPQIVLLQNGKALEEKLIHYYQNVIKFQIKDDYSYKYFWKEVASVLSNHKRIYFSPDGVYNKINLNAILNPATGKFVFDEIEIITITNTKDLLNKKVVTNTNNSITLIGDPDFSFHNDSGKDYKGYSLRLHPLPGTKKEVELIKGTMSSNKWKTKIHTGKEATEKNIKLLEDSKVLHIATHGYFDDSGDGQMKDYKEFSNPLFKSGLYLADNKSHTEDGVLTAYEAMNLNLDNTELVVLSACETGLGEVKNGEGVYGLQRAFRVAGAKTLLISLWKVDDETTQLLMTYFYEQWLKTFDKRIAFKNAQNNLRQKFPNPYYWAAFMMVGE